MSPLVLLTVLFTQVTVPEITPEHKPIVARLSIQADKEAEVTVTWSADPGTVFLPAGELGVIHLWSAPGEHWVKASATVIKFRQLEVFVPDPQDPSNFAKAKKETLKIFLSSEVKEFPTEKFIVTESPRPPPDDEDVKPNPKPVPPKPTPVASRLHFLIIEDSFNRKPETSLILNDRKFWDGLEARGHSYEVQPENYPSTRIKQYVKIIYEVEGVSKFNTGAAYLFVQDKTTGKVLETLDLPTVAEIENLIFKYTGKQ